MTVFAEILRRAVEATPGAVGGAFADSTGEMVESFATYDPHEWALLTAHYGVVLSHLSSMLGAWHFGGPEYFIAQHAVMDVVVHSVHGGYYALLALSLPNGAPSPLALALSSLRIAARQLHQEMH